MIAVISSYRDEQPEEKPIWSRERTNISDGNLEIRSVFEPESPKNTMRGDLRNMERKKKIRTRSVHIISDD